MYLNTARTLLLNSSVKQELGGPKLAKWLIDNYAKFVLLKNPVSLIFEKLTHKKFGIGMLVNKHDRPVMSAEAFHNLPSESKISLKMFGYHIKDWSIPHIPLTGWMMSRMQSNSWHSDIKQNFRLKASKGSWIQMYWHLYRAKFSLSSKVLTTFTASSFACHHLLNWPFKKAKGSVRYVSTTRKSSSRRSSSSENNRVV
jgi:sensor histidine kinase YesM